jgi:glycyl-tRNA synthetase beta chain
MSAPRDLLLEIGVEELPSSFVEAALRALPDLAKKRLADLRLTHGDVEILGTPRRLSLIVRHLVEQQPDLSEDLLGPPVSAGFDKAGNPTRAAQAFADKLGIEVSAIEKRETPKGVYLAGRRSEKGKPTAELLVPALSALVAAIPFRKSMRWSEEAPDATFGRPVRWLVALFGEEVIPFTFAGLTADRLSYGHRFLAPGVILLRDPSHYEAQLLEGHVVVNTAERQRMMLTRLHAAAQTIAGTLIEDEFLVGENLSLVEEPQIVVGSFEERFLALPEDVILEVARGHQRYFGVRGADGKLLPRYLAVVNTALAPENIVRGNDRVMRARLSDAQFFFDEDKKVGLSGRTKKLGGIVFHNRLGSVEEKVTRVVALTKAIGERLGVDAGKIATAVRGAELAKCDLATLMVGEFPELQGVMGRAYALAQGETAEVAEVVEEHYRPKGGSDAPALAHAAALVALADRFDSLVGCFAVGLVPTGAADPYALRRACLGAVRTLLSHGWDASTGELVELAYAQHAAQGTKLDLDAAACRRKVGEFFRDRLKNLLNDEIPADVLDACLAVAADRPLDVVARARALLALDAATRASVGEVFKRVTQIAKDAPSGEPVPPKEVDPQAHEAELALDASYRSLKSTLESAEKTGDYTAAFAAIAAFAPPLSEYFLHVFVMAEELPIRENRLRLLRAVRDACSTVAHVQLLRA